MIKVKEILSLTCFSFSFTFQMIGRWIEKSALVSFFLQIVAVVHMDNIVIRV